MAYGALQGYRPRPLGAVPPAPSSPYAWVPQSLPPFNPADYDPTKFANDQFNRWASPAIQAGIADGRTKLSQALKVTLPAVPSMTKSEIGDWTIQYVQLNGPPKSLEDGARMVTAFAHAQAQKLGVPPEYIAAADLVLHPPTTKEEALAMIANLGEAYFVKFAVPMLQNELMSVSTNLAMVTQAIPVQFAIAGFDALSDGKLSSQEVAGIAVQAAAYACGLLLQGLGIPAPIGALIAGVIAQGLAQVADDVIHADDADTRARQAALDALEQQREQLMTQCAAAAEQVWNKTQDYWDKLLVPIQTLLNQPLIAQHLNVAGGIRYYGTNVVTLPQGVTLPNAWPRSTWFDSSVVSAAADADAAAKSLEATAAANIGNKYYTTYLYQAQTARAKANALAAQAAAEKQKPLYQYGFDCLWWDGDLVSSYSPATSGYRQTYPASKRPYPDGCLYFTRKIPKFPGTQTLDPTRWMDAGYWPNPTMMWERCAVARPPSGYTYDPPSFHSSGDTESYCGSVMNWAAKWHYAFAATDSTRQMVVRLTPYTDHTSAVRTKLVTVESGAMVDGAPNAQAALMFWGAIRPATVYSPYSSSADAPDSAQWKSFAYIDPAEIQVYKQDGGLTAQLNLDADYCDMNTWISAVQTAAAASALVQQDIIRTVAWQVGAAQAHALATAAGARTSYQTGLATTVAAQARKALLQARAFAAARQSSGAFASALKARLRFQRVTFAKKALIVVGGAAAGALLFWFVTRKKKGQR